MNPKIYMTPTPSQAQSDTTNSINQIVLYMRDLLPELGYTLTEDPEEASLFVGHAGVSNPRYPLHLVYCHGLYPTVEYPDQAWTWKANENVIRDLKRAQGIIVPTDWVADIIRRDLHVNPTILPWGIDHAKWAPATRDTRGKYVLWNKTRQGGVCDPSPMNALAQKLPHVPFVSTFGQPASNVRIIGLQQYRQMKSTIEHAYVYLGVTKETFGIGTLEAMAAGVPVLGYDWGGTSDLVLHKDTGYLVPPGDIDGLMEGYHYIDRNWDRMSKEASLLAASYGWDEVLPGHANVFDQYPIKPSETRVSIVIPAHNYETYVDKAILSAIAQRSQVPFEVIVVVDQSSDNTLSIAQNMDLAHADPNMVRYQVYETTYGNPAQARNWGIEHSTGDYILCLDADDFLAPEAIHQFMSYLDEHPQAGIVYSKLQVIDAENRVLRAESEWPGVCAPDMQINRRNQVPSCCMFRRQAWVRAGGYRTLPVPAEDADLWTRMMLLGYEAHLIPIGRPLVSYRMHDRSLSAPIRHQQRPEPNWAQPFERARRHNPPFVSVTKPTRFTHPVNNYDQPLFSIIIPVGPHHGQYVTDALDSVEAQTDPRWECIVVNDTSNQLRLFERGYVWPQVTLPIYESRGPGAARNSGVRQSKGRYIVFLDADDMLHPEFLEKAYAHFRKEGKYVYTDWFSMVEGGKIETHKTPAYDPNLLFQKGAIHGVTVFIPRVDFEDVGGFPEDMASWEDMEFFLRLARAGYCGTRLAEPLYTYRYHTGVMRNHADRNKDSLLTYIQTKYAHELEESKKGKMGCCGTPKRKPIHSVTAGDSMIRVKYEGLGVPGSPAPLRGSATRHMYGMRKAGDVFMVWTKDQKAMASVLHPMNEVEAMDWRPS